MEQKPASMRPGGEGASGRAQGATFILQGRVACAPDIFQSPKGRVGTSVLIDLDGVECPVPIAFWGLAAERAKGFSVGTPVEVKCGLRSTISTDRHGAIYYRIGLNGFWINRLQPSTPEVR